MDIILAVIIVILILPLAIMISLLVVSDGGPVIYPHRRVGRNGVEFNCLKFRTMCPHADVVLADVLQADPARRAEWQATRKLRHDPRVTRVGRFLRATSLDELPQLLNVIRGDMSLVGPRPVTIEELDAYYDAAARAAYLSTRPGITGLW